ncbi:MAG: GGDEF domain-containing protein [Treponema sp.]|jgi:diguanylate cyclase (GGDEF)-like protein|nr:GGDEF domain-containing protein [Treponema sp.]
MEEKEYPALEHIRRLLKDNVPPPLEGELVELPYFKEIHEELKGIREIMYSFSAGDFSPCIKVRGIIPGCMKALQSRLQHMIWQVQQVQNGDFSQKVEFLGEFSDAFNRMTAQLNSTLKALTNKEKALSALAENLRNEVNLRNSAMEALEKSESQFKYLASHDPLTGALNRRSFMEKASVELNNILLGVPCGIIMMDIDHFKNFNDSFGHLAGDEALRHAVRIIQSLLRKNDFLGRYGGEEFVFLFSRADETTGLAIVERVREAIEKNPVKLESGPVSITASFGLAMAEEYLQAQSLPDNYIETLINNADSALYEAKRSGRNRVACYKPKSIVY